MDLKKSIQISTPGAIFFTVVLATTSFFSGYSLMRNNLPATKVDSTNSVAFAPTKSAKPELEFYVMSFCPYGNQMEDTLRPVFDLLGSKVNFQPRYIFEKISDINSYCQSRSGDPAQCAAYIKNGYFKTDDECKKAISGNLSKCKDEKAYIKAENGTMYASLHGRIEANQDVREICAFNLATDKKQWWDFIANVNKNCDSTNADTCWEQQAKQAGFDTNKITECFNKEGIALIEKEIALTEKNQVSGSPTVLVNSTQFPPEAAYAQDGKGSIKIGKAVIGQEDYRTPNALKEAVCSGFSKAPGECKKALAKLDGSAPAAGGCN
ncbi:MAG TPA: hypothetical protein PK370_00575 [Candidatus Woesebacteria bacterium]|nr:hypothetical protein [Candidatus Woesebacteria bacterium]